MVTVIFVPSSEKLSALNERICSLFGAIVFILEQTTFRKGLAMQESKQEDSRSVSFEGKSTIRIQSP